MALEDGHKYAIVFLLVTSIYCIIVFSLAQYEGVAEYDDCVARKIDAETAIFNSYTVNVLPDALRAAGYTTEQILDILDEKQESDTEVRPKLDCAKLHAGGDKDQGWMTGKQQDSFIIWWMIYFLALHLAAFVYACIGICDWFNEGKHKGCCQGMLAGCAGLYERLCCCCSGGGYDFISGGNNNNNNSSIIKNSSSSSSGSSSSSSSSSSNSNNNNDGDDV